MKAAILSPSDSKASRTSSISPKRISLPAGETGPIFGINGPYTGDDCQKICSQGSSSPQQTYKDFSGAHSSSPRCSESLHGNSGQPSTPRPHPLESACADIPTSWRSLRQRLWPPRHLSEPRTCRNRTDHGVVLPAVHSMGCERASMSSISRVPLDLDQLISVTTAVALVVMDRVLKLLLRLKATGELVTMFTTAHSDAAFVAAATILGWLWPKFVTEYMHKKSMYSFPSTSHALDPCALTRAIWAACRCQNAQAVIRGAGQDILDMGQSPQLHSCRRCPRPLGSSETQSFVDSDLNPYLTPAEGLFLFFKVGFVQSPHLLERPAQSITRIVPPSTNHFTLSCMLRNLRMGPAGAHLSAAS